MATFLSWPMRLGPDGRFRTATSPEEVWSNRLAQLVCARMGERVMREDYGTTLPQTIFENALDDPKSAITTAVGKWLPALSIDDVTVIKDEAAYQVTILFTTPEGKSLENKVSLAVTGEALA
jgi:phage baseplate assembly protein W